MTTPPLPSQHIKPVNPLNKTAFNARLAITVSIIAIVFATTGFLLGVLNYHGSINQSKDIKSALSNNIKTQADISNISKNIEAESVKLADTQAQLQKLENTQNIPLQKTLAEINYLVHLANLHLTVGRDKETALNLLTIANHHLTPIQNTIFTPLKEALNADINKLKTTPTPNIIHIYSQLTHITNDVNQLNPFPIRVKQTIHDTVSNIKKSAKNESHWYNRIWNSLKEIKHLFVINEIQTTSAPVTAPDKIFYIKQNIEIKLSTAQWALLHSNNEIYQSCLKTVSNWITQYFSMSESAEPILKQVNFLSQQNIANHLPNLENTINTLNKIKIQPPTIHQHIESTNTTKKTEEKNNSVTPHAVKPIESTKSVEI